jgi:hypothetical protein
MTDRVGNYNFPVATPCEVGSPFWGNNFFVCFSTKVLTLWVIISSIKKLVETQTCYLNLPIQFIIEPKIAILTPSGSSVYRKNLTKFLKTP